MTDLAVRSPRDPAAAGPPIVIVHGAMDRAANFERVRRRLADRQVITYDRRGYADSLRRPCSADLSRHVADLLEVIDGEPAVVIGHSFGGLVALGAAARAPQLALSVGVYEPPQPWRPFWPPPPDWHTAAEAAEIFFRHNIGSDAWARLPEQVKAERRAEGAALMADYNAAGKGMPFELADILSPVVVAYGTDTAPHFERASLALCDEIHGAVCVALDGASHGAHLSHPDAFASWVRQVAGLASAAAN